jgi:hypothetical protein
MVPRHLPALPEEARESEGREEEGEEGMKKVHMIANRPYHFHVLTACRRVYDTWEVPASTQWKRVTCLRCLKKRPKAKKPR